MSASSIKRTGALAGTTLLALALTTLGAGGASATSSGSQVVGHSYINANTSGTNAVDVLDRHADGTSTFNSQVAIGGSGATGGLGSQGAIQQTPNHQLLLAVDAGSNEISVLRLDQDGIPSLVGAPVPSGGERPVSIAISPDGHLVYVANNGTATNPGHSNYTGFTLDSNGTLTPLAGSTFPLPDNAKPVDVLFNSNGKTLAGTRVAPDNDTPGLVDSFSVGNDGHLSAAPGSPFLTGRVGPIGAAFTPNGPSQLFVSNAHDGALNGSITAFDVAKDSSLTTIGAPYADYQTAPCWVAISPDSKYLYTTNTASGTISSYAVAGDGVLTLVGSFSFTNGSGAVDIAVTQDGKYVSVTGGRGHVLTTFAADNGALTELTGSPVALPAGGNPAGLVIS